MPSSLLSSLFIIFLHLISFGLLIINCNGIAQTKQTNLIFIMFDDLRTELAAYGKDYMITPNFDRLAKQSVIFDYAFAQIAVCNPSRDSLLTGLRPDTTGTYGFQSSFRPHRVFPSELIASGYNTAGYGKIFHWDGADKSIWNFDQWENDWYSYQHKETMHMNSSTMPDKITPEDKFRDHLFASKAIETLHELAKQPKYFMLGIGFKLPHLAVHVPFRYYEMYKGMQHHWKLSRRESRFPLSSPDVAYRCCANPRFEFMNEEGAKRHTQSLHLGDINFVFSDKIRDELMLGYCAAITYVDFQLGRLLDAVDSLGLWENTTIILTADHGMHNGEKGIWEKWSLFDESTRVPLLISHPQSPNKGKHFSPPVELIDIYPTVRDILGAKFGSPCPPGGICRDLQGKSLANILLTPGGTETPTVSIQKVVHKRNKGAKNRGSSTNLVTVAHHRHLADNENAVQVRHARKARYLLDRDNRKATSNNIPAASSDSAEVLRLKQQVLELQQSLEVKENELKMSETSKSDSVPLFHEWKETISSWLFGSSESRRSAPVPNSVASKPKLRKYELPAVQDISISAIADTKSSTITPDGKSSKTTLPSKQAKVPLSLPKESFGRAPDSYPMHPASSSSSNSIKNIKRTVPTTSNMWELASPSDNSSTAQFFAISQSWRCAPLKGVQKVAQSLEALSKYNSTAIREGKFRREMAGWFVCDVNNAPADEVSVMGYSIRTSEYRYTAWFTYNRQLCLPNIDAAPLYEEYYDHRGEKLSDATHLETRNLLGHGLGIGSRARGDHMARDVRDKLVNIIKTQFIFRGCFKP